MAPIPLTLVGILPGHWLFGAVGATVLTLIAVPLLYFEFFQKKPCPMAEQMEETSKGWVKHSAED